MDIYQRLFQHGSYVHYLVFDNEYLIGVFDNIKDACKMILHEPNTDCIKIKELYVNKSWRNYKKNMKVYETVDTKSLKQILDIVNIYVNKTRTLGAYELIFLKFMLNPELLVRSEKMVNMVKMRLSEFKRVHKKKGLRSSLIMNEFEKFLKRALYRYDSYSHRPYNLRSKNRFSY
jgi:hypothetical protein